MDAGCIFHDWKCVVQSIRCSMVAKFYFKVKCTALMTVLQRPIICVFFLSFIQATLNEVYTLLMSILQRNELWKNSSKHVPTVHTKDCISHALCFHKTFPTICCCSACTSLSFLQLKFANRKAFQCWQTHAFPEIWSHVFQEWLGTPRRYNIKATSITFSHFLIAPLHGSHSLSLEI